jgi:hypothetical protein
MTDDLHIGAPHDRAPRRTPFRFALLAGAAVVLVIMAALLLPSSILMNPWFHGNPSTSDKRHLTPGGVQQFFGPAEQAYAPRLQIENITMSKAENFLNQEVTTLAGEVANSGDRSLLGLELTIEFYDSLHEVILRESRSVLDPAAAPLAPGARRSFEISFEHLPPSWNFEQPVIRVSALRFSSAK